ncbi:MAG: DUF4091 domain-containing protein [Planctomycetota bacterium]|nr:DUF4091 domain-containing protein [Planctomycetota bacterium]
MILLPFLAGILISSAGPTIVLFDELTPLYPDTDVVDGSSTFKLAATRGTIAGVHMIVTDLQADQAISLLSDTGGQWYQLLPVPVEENTGLRSRTEVFDGEINPYVIRRAPFEIYEVLKPIDNSFIPKSETIALRYETAIQADARPEIKIIDLTVLQGKYQCNSKFMLEIYPAIVSPSGADSLPYTNWFSINNMATKHGITPDSQDHWEMVEQYANMMRRGRQNTFMLGWNDFFSGGENPILNKVKLQEVVNRFTNAGLWWIEGAPIANRPNGDWSSKRLQLRIGGELVTSKEGKKMLESTATQVMNAIKEFGWEDRWIQHIADEPTNTNSQDYKKIATLLRSHMPNISIVEATMSRELVDAVDIWCPQVQEFQANKDFFEERKKLGDQVWTYTCLIPGGPWLNRLLDMERLRQVYFGWAASKYSLDGFLHWGFNHYKCDPFKQSAVDHPAAPNTNNRLPAGDTHVVFPGDEGPWSGLRFEAHRIGLEDYELLEQLRAINKNLHSSIINEMIRGYDEYEIDIAKYRNARLRLFKALQ